MPADYDDWTSGLEALLAFLQENRVLILNAYNSINHEVVADYVKKGLQPYCAAIVEGQAEAMDQQTSREDREFTTELLTLSASGIVMDWISKQMLFKEKAVESMKRLKIAMNGSVQLMLRNLSGAEEQSGPASTD